MTHYAKDNPQPSSATASSPIWPTVIIVHAAPSSKIEALSLDLLTSGKPLYTFDHPANASLIQNGAHPITPETDWKRILI